MKLRCTCKHDDQDKLNGNSIRVHNRTLKSKGQEKVYRCSVCGTERTGK